MSFVMSLGAALSLLSGQGNLDRSYEPDFKIINRKIEVITQEAIKGDDLFKGFSLKFDEAFSNLELGRLGFEFNTTVAKSYWTSGESSLKLKAAIDTKALADDPVKMTIDLGFGLKTDFLAFVRENIKRAKLGEPDAGNEFDVEMHRLVRSLETASTLEDLGAFVDGVNAAVEKYGDDDVKKVFKALRFRSESNSDGKLEAIVLEVKNALELDRSFAGISEFKNLGVVARASSAAAGVDFSLSLDVRKNEVLDALEQVRNALGLIEEGDENTLQEIADSVKSYLEIVKSFVLEGTTFNFAK